MEHTTVEMEPAVQFSAKELFIQVNQKIDTVLTVLSQKADRIEHDKVEQQVDEIMRDGTPQSKQILLDMRELSGKFIQLEKQSATQTAVGAAVQRIEASEHDTKMQWLAILFSFLIGFATLIVAVVSLYKK